MENLYCDKILKDYIKYQSRKCGTDANSYVLEEGLPLTFISESSHIINKKIFFCTVLEGKFVREISIINKKMCEINISPVFFKGIILGKQLYKNSYVRGLGDIDIWVDEDCFEKASASLQELGYIKVKKEIEVEKHHLVYLKDIFTVELHRSFITPRLRLDTESFRNHFMFFSVEPDVKVRTLDKSATILHLLYHLYMDIFITYANNHYLVMMGVINKVPRFLFRSYEIALFIEKNYKEIDWEYLINEIKKQKIGKWFKYMLSEIEKIFGPVFQKEFRNVIYRINYYKMFDPWHLYRTITRYGGWWRGTDI